MMADYVGSSRGKQKETILFKKIKDSVVLKPYIDYYNMIDKDHKDHTYTYLIDSINRYLTKTKADGNMDRLTNTLLKGGGGGRGQGRDNKARTYAEGR